MVLSKILYRVVRFRRRKIKIRSFTFSAMIADSFLKQALGLMHRSSMRSNECMLFSFGRESRYGIWMLNMNFPIDIIWADSSGKVVDIMENAVQCSGIMGCGTYNPSLPAKYVLEFNAGVARRIGIKRGCILPALRRRLN